MRHSLRFGSVLIAIANLASGNLLAGNKLQDSLNCLLDLQWKDRSVIAIQAIESYGTSANSTAALKILKKGATPDAQALYDAAVYSLGDEFWRLVAGYHASNVVADFKGAEDAMAFGFPANAALIVKTSRAYHEQGEFAALSVLLSMGWTCEQNAMFRACFDLNPRKLFARVDEVLGKNN